MALWYLSFATESQCLGGCFVESESMHRALLKTHRLKINPASHTPPTECSVMCYEVREADKVLPIVKSSMDRLLTKDEVMALDRQFAAQHAN